ncbi:MAG: cobalamin biosynthesis protein CobW, partial [Ruminococcus sp.]|nr:cobalamin biosynthesis protein CobW [Ruminococcus sp.]
AGHEHHHHHDHDEHEHHHDHDEHCHHDHDEHEHHHDHDEHCHHDHDEHEHHHDHDEHCHHDHDEHEHHHDHGPDCTCGCHDHDHDHDHHHHHADEVFTSWGKETPRTYTPEAIETALNALADEEKFGIVLRAKGIVAGEDGQWIHFDYVPGVPDVRHGSAETTGRLCVIGSKLNEEAVAKLFCVE